MAITAASAGGTGADTMIDRGQALKWCADGIRTMELNTFAEGKIPPPIGQVRAEVVRRLGIMFPLNVQKMRQGDLHDSVRFLLGDPTRTKPADDDIPGQTIYFAGDAFRLAMATRLGFASPVPEPVAKEKPDVVRGAELREIWTYIDGRFQNPAVILPNDFDMAARNERLKRFHDSLALREIRSWDDITPLFRERLAVDAELQAPGVSQMQVVPNLYIEHQALLRALASRYSLPGRMPESAVSMEGLPMYSPETEWHARLPKLPDHFIVTHLSGIPEAVGEHFSSRPPGGLQIRHNWPAVQLVICDLLMLRMSKSIGDVAALYRQRNIHMGSVLQQILIGLDDIADLPGPPLDADTILQQCGLEAVPLQALADPPHPRLGLGGQTPPSAGRFATSPSLTSLDTAAAGTSGMPLAELRFLPTDLPTWHAAVTPALQKITALLLRYARSGTEIPEAIHSALLLLSAQISSQNPYLVTPDAAGLIPRHPGITRVTQLVGILRETFNLTTRPLLTLVEPDVRRAIEDMCEEVFRDVEDAPFERTRTATGLSAAVSEAGGEPAPIVYTLPNSTKLTFAGVKDLYGIGVNLLSGALPARIDPNDPRIGAFPELLVFIRSATWRETDIMDAVPIDTAARLNVTVHPLTSPIGSKLVAEHELCRSGTATSSTRGTKLLINMSMMNATGRGVAIAFADAAMYSLRREQGTTELQANMARATANASASDVLSGNRAIPLAQQTVAARGIADMDAWVDFLAGGSAEAVDYMRAVHNLVFDEPPFSLAEMRLRATSVQCVSMAAFPPGPPPAAGDIETSKAKFARMLDAIYRALWSSDMPAVGAKVTTVTLPPPTKAAPALVAEADAQVQYEITRDNWEEIMGAAIETGIIEEANETSRVAEGPALGANMGDSITEWFMGIDHGVTFPVRNQADVENLLARTEDGFRQAAQIMSGPGDMALLAGGLARAQAILRERATEMLLTGSPLPAADRAPDSGGTPESTPATRPLPEEHLMVILDRYTAPMRFAAAKLVTSIPDEANRVRAEELCSSFSDMVPEVVYAGHEYPITTLEKVDDMVRRHTTLMLAHTLSLKDVASAKDMLEYQNTGIVAFAEMSDKAKEYMRKAPGTLSALIPSARAEGLWKGWRTRSFARPVGAGTKDTEVDVVKAACKSDFKIVDPIKSWADFDKLARKLVGIADGGELPMQMASDLSRAHAERLLAIRDHMILNGNFPGGSATAPVLMQIAEWRPAIVDPRSVGGELVLQMHAAAKGRGAGAIAGTPRARALEIADAAIGQELVHHKKLVSSQPQVTALGARFKRACLAPAYPSGARKELVENWFDTGWTQVLAGLRVGYAIPADTTAAAAPEPRFCFPSDPDAPPEDDDAEDAPGTIGKKTWDAYVDREVMAVTTGLGPWVAGVGKGKRKEIVSGWSKKFAKDIPEKLKAVPVPIVGIQGLRDVQNTCIAIQKNYVSATLASSLQIDRGSGVSPDTMRSDMNMLANGYYQPMMDGACAHVAKTVGVSTDGYVIDEPHAHTPFNQLGSSADASADGGEPGEELMRKWVGSRNRVLSQTSVAPNHARLTALAVGMEKVRADTTRAILRQGCPAWADFDARVREAFTAIDAFVVGYPREYEPIWVDAKRELAHHFRALHDILETDGTPRDGASAEIAAVETVIAAPKPRAIRDTQLAGCVAIETSNIAVRPGSMAHIDQCVEAMTRERAELLRSKKEVARVGADLRNRIATTNTGMQDDAVKVFDACWVIIDQAMTEEYLLPEGGDVEPVAVATVIASLQEAERVGGLSLRRQMVQRRGGTFTGSEPFNSMIPPKIITDLCPNDIRKPSDLALIAFYVHGLTWGQESITRTPSVEDERYRLELIAAFDRTFGDIAERLGGERFSLANAEGMQGLDGDGPNVIERTEVIRRVGECYASIAAEAVGQTWPTGVDGARVQAEILEYCTHAAEEFEAYASVWFPEKIRSGMPLMGATTFIATVNALVVDWLYTAGINNDRVNAWSDERLGARVLAVIRDMEKGLERRAVGTSDRFTADLPGTEKIVWPRGYTIGNGDAKVLNPNRVSKDAKPIITKWPEFPAEAGADKAATDICVAFSRGLRESNATALKDGPITTADVFLALLAAYGAAIETAVQARVDGVDAGVVARVRVFALLALHQYVADWRTPILARLGVTPIVRGADGGGDNEEEEEKPDGEGANDEGESGDTTERDGDGASDTGSGAPDRGPRIKVSRAPQRPRMTDAGTIDTAFGARGVVTPAERAKMLATGVRNLAAAVTEDTTVQEQVERFVTQTLAGAGGSGPEIQRAVLRGLRGLARANPSAAPVVGDVVSAIGGMTTTGELITALLPALPKPVPVQRTRQVIETPTASSATNLVQKGDSGTADAVTDTTITDGADALAETGTTTLTNAVTGEANEAADNGPVITAVAVDADTLTVTITDPDSATGSLTSSVTLPLVGDVRDEAVEIRQIPADAATAAVTPSVRTPRRRQGGADSVEGVARQRIRTVLLQAASETSGHPVEAPEELSDDALNAAGRRLARELNLLFAGPVDETVRDARQQLVYLVMMAMGEYHKAVSPPSNDDGPLNT